MSVLQSAGCEKGREKVGRESVRERVGIREWNREGGIVKIGGWWGRESEKESEKAVQDMYSAGSKKNYRQSEPTLLRILTASVGVFFNLLLSTFIVASFYLMLLLGTVG